MECNVLIGGEAGQGMFSVELELSEILSRLGYPFFATKNYMSRIRGGHNYHMVRVADRRRPSAPTTGQFCFFA